MAWQGLLPHGPQVSLTATGAQVQGPGILGSTSRWRCVRNAAAHVQGSAEGAAGTWEVSQPVRGDRSTCVTALQGVRGDQWKVPRSGGRAGTSFPPSLPHPLLPAPFLLPWAHCGTTAAPSIAWTTPRTALTQAARTARRRGPQPSRGEWPLTACWGRGVTRVASFPTWGCHSWAQEHLRAVGWHKTPTQSKLSFCWNPLCPLLDA